MRTAEAARAQQLPELDPWEVSSGVVLGRRRTPAAHLDAQPVGAPREILEGLLLQALQRPPCVVAFSGGRDSSALLAEAARVAREHGLEEPIPQSLIFGDAPRAAEDEWQRMVIDHLGLSEWSRRKVAKGELDALAPLGRDVIARHGVHWPPNAHTSKLMLEPAADGSLVTGNGGDELFSPFGGHRLWRLRHGRAIPRRDEIRPLLISLLPASVYGRRPRFRLPWLSPAAARRVGREFASSLGQGYRTWSEAIESYLNSRYLEVGLAITGAIAEDARVQLVEPFFDPRYMRSVCADAPPEGYPTRAAAMERHFGEVLPLELPRRTTKAVFTEAFTGPETRRFAREWDGAGLDPELVDGEALREMWLSPKPDLRSLVPIQAAWLASS